MKVLWSWLRELAPFEGDPVALGEVMSSLGMAVEDLVPVGEGLDGVVVAEVLALRPHPDADRVQLVDVSTGGPEPLQVVCGAFNMGVGDRVPLATVGATLPGGLEIARRKLRGQWSNGMLCAAREIGLGDDAGGILVLPPDAPLGAPLAEALGITADVLYDLEINPNRPDAMSVVGVARDLAAHLGLPLSLPDPQPAEAGEEAGELVGVELRDPGLCGRFVARVLSGVGSGPSPAWVQRRLTALGMRPINAVVDASNYVMLELGQPSHTFDLARVAGQRLLVRRARAGERLTTLDGVERELAAGDGVICDADDQPISLAGVMGGASTEIHEGTTDVLLEMAWWDPMSVARTSHRLGLRSEASARFERGTDPEVIDLAMRRFVEVLGSGSLHPGSVDQRGDLPPPARVRVRTARVNALLGTELTTEHVRGYLEPIGFRVEPLGGDGLDVVVPSFRPDTTTETDVIEEVARHHGYERIARTVPKPAQTGGLTTRQRDQRLVRRTLVGVGLVEAMPNPFLAPGDLADAGLPDVGIRLANPLVAEESVLRTSLLPGLVKAVAYNERHRSAGVSLFELGHVFLPPHDGADLPDERHHLAVALAGREAPAAVTVLRQLLTVLDMGLRLEPREVPGLHPTRTARVLVGEADVGAVGEVDPVVLERYGVDERVAYLELDLGVLLELPHGAHTYRPISRYPSADIDLAFLVHDDTPAAAVEAAVRRAAGDLLAELRLFDVYRDESLGDGNRSLAYTLRLQAADRTLTDDDVARVREACIAAVRSEVGATLRG